MFSFSQLRSPDKEFRIPTMLLQQMQLFQRQPEWITRGKYTIRSNVDAKVVDLLFARIMGDATTTVTAENAEQLRELCNELGFSGFDDEIRAVLSGDWNMRKDVVCLRDRFVRHDVIIEELQRRVFDLERKLQEQRDIPERVEEVERRVEEIHRNVDEALAAVRREARNTCVNSQPRMDAPSETQVMGLPEEVVLLKERESEAFLDGVIARLTTACGGNVHELGVVEVTTSSGGDGRRAVELGTDSDFCSGDRPNSWICYDFKGRRVAPTSYSIRSYHDQFPKSWVFEVSNDGSEGTWEIVDKRANDKSLKSKYVTHNFEISQHLGGSYRFVRLRQTGKNHSGKDVLCLTSLELFGTITNIPRPVAAPGEFPFYDLQPLDGIIAHLTHECGGNVYKKGVVTATSSCTSWCRNNDAFANVFELGTNSGVPFCSKNEPNSWICYDFKGRRVTPTSYSIRSGHNESPKSWVFEVSNDGSEGTWEIVDRRENDKELYSWMEPVTRNFAISVPPRGSFRFVRLRQTGKNHHGTNILRLTSLEVFGALTDIPRPVPAPGEFPFDDMRPLDGVIAHLTHECGGNVHEKGIVEVTASRCVGGMVSNAVALEKNSYFASDDEPNSWISYDFKGRRLAPTSYSIWSSRSCFPRSWVFEVSNDGSEGSWRVVDIRDGDEELDGQLVIRNFAITDTTRGSFRFVRLRQTGKNHQESNYLQFNSLEVFGTLSSE